MLEYLFILMFSFTSLVALWRVINIFRETKYFAKKKKKKKKMETENYGPLVSLQPVTKNNSTKWSL